MPKPTLLMAMPTPGSVHVETLKTIIDLTQRLAERGIAFSIKTFEGSDIVISRNFLMSWFLNQPVYSHALLLDSDMAFSADTVFRMLELDEPFVCAAYPQRSLNLSRFRSRIEEDLEKPEAERRPIQDILAATLTYNVQEQLNAGEPWQSKSRNGFRTVPGAGTGLMLIARSVPEKMVASGTARRLARHDDLPLYAGAKMHDFFSHLTDKDGTLMYGEDQSFCRRWIEDCEGEIWCDEQAVVTHFGMFGFQGCIAKQGA